MSGSKILTIVGMGEGNGMGLARRFGEEGFTIAMIARTDQQLKKYQKILQQEKIESYYYLADSSDGPELRNSLALIHESLGPTEVLIYNPAAARPVNLLEISEDALAADLRVNVIGALTAVQAVRPAMEHAGGGKIFFTGGGFALQPDPKYGSLAMGKAALRNLAFSLHQQLKPLNIHVATVTIQGHIQPGAEKYNPPAIAALYWELYQQTSEEQEKEVLF